MFANIEIWSHGVAEMTVEDGSTHIAAEIQDILSVILRETQRDEDGD